MIKKSLFLLLFIQLLGSPLLHAQHVAINNNVLFDVVGALSAGVEVPFSSKISLEVYGSIRPWKRREQRVGKHWLMQAQYRLWPCQVMNGFFYGPYIHAGEFNIGGKDLLARMLLKQPKQYRYEGWLIGAGMGVGYEYALAKHLNLGVEVGVGYTYIKYKQFNCEVCGAPKDDSRKHYVGLSRLALSLIYVF